MGSIDGTFSLRNAHELIGSELALSDWKIINQEVVDSFGLATFHDAWGHLDPIRAKSQLPFGGTLVQGLLVAGLLPYFRNLCSIEPIDSKYSLNYGFNRIRFLKPIVTGDGVLLRARVHLLAIDEGSRAGQKLLTTSYTIEQADVDGPVAYLEWLTLEVED